MYAPTNTSAPSPTAPGTSRTSRPTVMHTASIRAMNVVPRMKPSTASNARRPIASTRSPVPRGATVWARCTARSESRRKKKVSSRASTLVATSEPIRLMPLSRPPAALAPNFTTRLFALSARSSTSVVPPISRWSTIHWPASFSEATIWSPESMRAVTTMYPAPPTTATRAAQVSPAASDRFSLRAISHRWTGPSRAVPSSASSTGVTAVFRTTTSQTTTAATPTTSRTTPHQAAALRAFSGRTV
ncbi:hypothetical protein SCALM49S_06238 [Streptomyces californicus]